MESENCKAERIGGVSLVAVGHGIEGEGADLDFVGTECHEGVSILCDDCVTSLVEGWGPCPLDFESLSEGRVIQRGKSLSG